jgi:SMC interacting uncharacterized protein involved in chromosome segregation
MSEWWQPSFDPMEALISNGHKIRTLEHNQRELIKAQNDLGQSMKELVLQHNELIGALHNHKREIEQLKQQITALQYK